LYLISTLQQKKPDMKTVKYIRVSTSEQNEDRQREKGLKHYIDKCSGSIPFTNRPEASKMARDIRESQDLPPSKRISTVKVHSISRLGRSTIDILETVKKFNVMGICLVAEKEGVRTLNEDGSENATAKMMLSILATLFEFEREMILERQREGIAKAQLRGAYAANGGRPTENKMEFLLKDKNKRVLSYLSNGASIRDAAHRSRVSNGTAAKVRKIGSELGLLDADVSIHSASKERLTKIMEDKHISSRTMDRMGTIDGIDAKELLGEKE
jgi:DNA invertase Pin-like site-specific DNA recombinase